MSIKDLIVKDGDELTILKARIQKYEEFLHAINTYAAIVIDGEKVRKLIDNACSWSYAHRVGNGEYTDREQQDIIDSRFDRLTDVS